jgi:hypothetical protein
MELAETTQKPGNQENQQDCAQANAGAPAIAPASVPVIASATTEYQQQNNNEYQHDFIPFSQSLLVKDFPTLPILRGTVPKS